MNKRKENYLIREQKDKNKNKTKKQYKNYML